MKKILVIGLLIVLLLSIQGQETMPIKLTAQGTQYVRYAPTISGSMSPLSLSLWVNFDSVAGAYTKSIFGIENPINNSYKRYLAFLETNKFQWDVYYSVSNADYQTNTTYTSGTNYHVVVTHDLSSTPLIYINGVSVAYTTIAPSGVRDDTGTVPIIGEDGNSPANYRTINGTVSDVRLYNRILSADEVSILYNSRHQRVVLSGLVFWSDLNGAAGITEDGASLGVSNTFLDMITGLKGTPSGTASMFKQNNFLSFGGQ